MTVLSIVNKFDELIGSTPLFDLGGGILAKLEFFNPAGSIKDRAALYMINEAEKSGKIKAGDIYRIAKGIKNDLQ